MATGGLKAILAFLTTFPVGVEEDSFERAAANMPFFAVVGLAIGALVGLVGLAFAAVLPRIVAGILTLGVLLLITGVHHTDGLLDFGDGLMKRGTREEKIEAMHDTATGAGGFALGAIVVLTTSFSIASLPLFGIPLALASAETAAKASMTMAAGLGRSAHPGMNTLFVRAMHSGRRIVRITAPCVFALAVGFLSSGLAGLAAVVGCFASAGILVAVAERHFGGLTGDVLGAVNDIGRMVALVVIASGLR